MSDIEVVSIRIKGLSKWGGPLFSLNKVLILNRTIMTDKQNYNPYLNPSRWVRLIAATVDFLIVVAVMIPIIYILDFCQQTPNESSLYNSLFFSVLNFITFAFVNWKLMKRRGQTIGKKIFRIRVVLLDGSKPSMNILVLKRYVFMYFIPLVPVVGGILGLVNILMIFEGERRCFHDRIAGTKVISD